jgi:hypothetical protein
VVVFASLGIAREWGYALEILSAALRIMRRATAIIQIKTENKARRTDEANCR